MLFCQFSNYALDKDYPTQLTLITINGFPCTFRTMISYLLRTFRPDLQSRVVVIGENKLVSQAPE